MHKYNFNDIEIFEINGKSKINFTGSFTQNELAEELINRWIPYLECHNCGRGDFCSFTQAHPINKLKKLDIKCGAAKTALRNYISCTISVLDNASKIEQQKYIDSLYYFYQYVYSSEQINGYFIDSKRFEDFRHENIKFILSDLVSLRDNLNSLAENIKDSQSLYKNKNILLVEGETELKFIENFCGDNIFSILCDINIKNYKGKGNRSPKRIQMLIEKYITEGYSIYFQGDADGKGNGSGYDKFKTYVDNGIILKENIFQFKYDFESSIPRNLLYEILLELGYLSDIKLGSFIKLPSDESINKILFENLNIDTEKNKLKIKIAKKTGKVFFYKHFKDENEYQDSELAEFVRFIQKIR